MKNAQMAKISFPNGKFMAGLPQCRRTTRSPRAWTCPHRGCPVAAGNHRGGHFDGVNMCATGTWSMRGVYIYIYIYIYIYMCVCPRVYSHIIWIHMDVCTCVHLIIFMCVWPDYLLKYIEILWHVFKETIQLYKYVYKHLSQLAPLVFCVIDSAHLDVQMMHPNA